MRKCSCHASKDLSCWLTEYLIKNKKNKNKKKKKKTTKNNLLCRTDTKPRPIRLQNITILKIHENVKVP